MTTLTCTCCKLEVRGDDDLKSHYKSDFHRYNTKRYLVKLPPITLESFKQKKAQAAEKKEEKQETLECKSCNKKFASKSTYQQHIDSSRHKDVERGVREASLKASKSSSSSNLITLESNQSEKSPSQVPRVTTMEDVSVCLFCNAKSEDLDENLLHMRVSHSFFISEAKYCTKVPELLKYLSEKINLGCLCIYCENNKAKDFKSGYAVQSHMMDRGHCFMKTDDFAEYARFFDFSSSIQNLQYEELDEKQIASLKRNEGILEIIDDDEEHKGDDSDSEWEDEDDDDVYEEVDEEEEEDQDGDESQIKEKKPVEKKEKVVRELTEEEQAKKAFRKAKKALKIRRLRVPKIEVLDSGEIRLPNGNIIGHRDYRQVYKQFYKEKASGRMGRLGIANIPEYQLALVTKQNQVAILNQLAEIKERFKAQYINHKTSHRNKIMHLRLGVKGNKVNQHHFIQATP